MKIMLDWYNKDGIWVKGFIREGSKYLTLEEMAEHFSEARSIRDFENKLNNANGQFSVVCERSGETWAAVDIVRSIPIFYLRSDQGYIISDQCYQLAEIISEKRLNKEAVGSFLTAGFAVNDMTLVEGIFQVEAGRYIVINDTLKSCCYHDPVAKELKSMTFEEAADELRNLLSIVFNDYLKALGNDFIAIPLSGGFDSRLIAASCLKYHPKNIICYTYGSKDSPEFEPAEEVARRLGFKWIKIVYDDAIIHGFIDDPWFEKYNVYASDLTSMFFMQEYFAVKYLKEKNLIPDKTVFIPGFSGDMLAGSHLFPGMNRMGTRHKASKIIVKNFFSLLKLSRRQRADMVRLAKKNITSDGSELWRVIESWDMKERQSKFIVNSARVFSFFGYKYVIPLWDKLLVDFFLSVPFEYKLNKALYDYVLKYGIFKEYDLNLEKEISPTPLAKRLQILKEDIKPVIPQAIRNLFISPESNIHYDKITAMLIEDMGPEKFIKPFQSNYYNSYLTQWYLLKISLDLKIDPPLNSIDELW